VRLNAVAAIRTGYYGSKSVCGELWSIPAVLPDGDAGVLSGRHLDLSALHCAEDQPALCLSTVLEGILLICRRAKMATSSPEIPSLIMCPIHLFMQRYDSAFISPRPVHDSAVDLYIAYRLHAIYLLNRLQPRRRCCQATAYRGIFSSISRLRVHERQTTIDTRRLYLSNQPRHHPAPTFSLHHTASPCRISLESSQMPDPAWLL
jgi:hypothetical protein